MNLIKLKLTLAKILNDSFVFFKENKPVVVKRINKIILINKNLLSEKNLLAIKSMAAIFFFSG